MNVISIVRKYIIKDLTGLVENYYLQKGIGKTGEFGCWKKVNDWNWGLYGACSGGHMEIIKYMISKGAGDLNGGFWRACIAGHMEIIKYMISKGVDDWVSGLEGACHGGHMEIVKYMISKGADEWDIDECPWNQYEEIQAYLISLNS